MTQAEAPPEPKVSTEAPPERPPDAPRRWLLAPFALLAVVMTFPNPSRLTSFVPGDYGDAMLNLWILRWVAHAAPEGFNAIWDTNLYYPNPNTLAWSDPLLGLVPFHWVLEQLSGSVALGFNLVYLAAWTLSLWFSYRLAFAFTARHGPSVVAALAFTFAAPRLSHAGHWQLSATGWMVPLILLLAVHHCRRPRLASGLALGASVAVLTVTSSYYGVIMALTVALVAAGFALVGRPPMRPYLGGLAAGGLLALVVIAPVALKYLDLPSDPTFERPPNPALEAHPEDFLAPDQEAYLLPHVPPFESRAFNRGVEKRLFPGVMALALGAVGVVVLVGALWGTRRSRTKSDSEEAPRSDGARSPSPNWRDARLLAVMTAAALTMLVLAFGRSLHLVGARIPMPYAVLEEVIPGLSSIRATSRFVIVAQCLLAVLAAVGLDRLLRRARPGQALLVSLLVSLAVIAESATPAALVRLPTDPAVLAVNQELAGRPPGVVVELPMGSPTDGSLHAFIEAPRLFLSSFDWQERVNGLSGFSPPGFDELAADLESFPGPAAFEHIDKLGVRYIVLRTEPVGNFPSSEVMNQDGVASYSERTVEKMLDGLPAERVVSVERHGEAYLVEIDQARAATASRKAP